MELIYVKEVDKSLLYQGFTIRTALLNSFLGIFGKLDIGEMRQISILLNGKIYSGIKVVNQNFDRNKYPNHPEMYQVRYDNKLLRQCLQQSHKAGYTGSEFPLRKTW